MRAAIVAVALALATAACGGGGTEASDTEGAQVLIEGFLYRPAELSVEPGATVRWSNRDQILHTVTAGTPDTPSEAFDGQLADVDATFTFKFPEPGTYPYFCSRHNHMRGTVTVR